MAVEPSVEYRTLLRLTGYIELTVKDHLIDIGGKLVESELITPAQYKEIRNTHNPVDSRAADLVGFVQGKVQQNPKHYHTFIDVLKSDQSQYGDLLKKLKDTYDSLAGPHPPSAAHKQQSNGGTPTPQATGEGRLFFSKL